MAIDFSQVKKIVIPEGEVKQITDSQGNVLWSLSLYELYEGYYLTSHSYVYNTNYIDLGIKWNNNWKLECKFYKPTTISQYGRLLGTGYDTSSEVYVNYNNVTNGDFVVNYGNIYASSLGNADQTNVEYNFAFGNRGIECSCYFLRPNEDWIGFGDSWSPSNTNSTHNLRLFSNEQGDRDGIYGIAKVQINGPDNLWSEDGALMLLVPARRKSDGRLGMYDKNNDIFYPCITSGTGYFTITDVNGNVIASELRKLEYIKFSGAEYVEENFNLATKNRKMLLEYTCDKFISNSTLLGQWDNTTTASQRRLYIARCNNTSGQAIWYIGGKYGLYNNMSLNTKYKSIVTYTNANANTLTYDFKNASGTTLESGTLTETSTSIPTIDNKAALGATKLKDANGNISYGGYWTGKLYKFEKYVASTNTLQNNQIPCQRKSDGVCGLYDTADKTFLPMTGTVITDAAAGTVIDEYWNLQA